MWQVSHGYLGLEWIQGKEWKRLKVSMDHRRRLSVKVYRKRRAVHRLVLEAFHGPCPIGHEASHYPDPDPANCNISNLRWECKVQNLAHRREHGTLAWGQKNGNSVLTEELAREALSLSRAGMSGKDIALKVGVSETTISRLINKKTWKYLD